MQGPVLRTNLSGACGSALRSATLGSLSRAPLALKCGCVSGGAMLLSSLLLPSHEEGRQGIRLPGTDAQTTPSFWNFPCKPRAGIKPRGLSSAVSRQLSCEQGSWPPLQGAVLTRSHCSHRLQANPQQGPWRQRPEPKKPLALPLEGPSRTQLQQ